MIKLEVGKKYKTEDGTEATCVGVTPYPSGTNDNYILVLNKKHPELVWYFENGRWMDENAHEDVVYPLDIVQAL